MEARCERHGKRESRFLCRHLTPESRGRGFFVDSEDGKAAWCAECDEDWGAEDEWNETVEGQLSIQHVCDLCFEAIRERNER